MPPVPLPVQTPGFVFTNVTNVPPMPQNPPNDDDAVRAYHYTESAIIAKRKGLIDDHSFVDALHLETPFEHIETGPRDRSLVTT
ncbi:hypothetical protein B0H10DRAFT_2213721 [Mycena sp. CBHHK59/15]|nr:hypothetical protein B0H10DRAFT_2213721 [Mycena sp. CBHHK59/15]